MGLISLVHVAIFLAAYGQAITLPTTGKSCPAGWLVSSNKCYLYDGTTTRSWTSCQSYCSGLGARLPCITSSTEKDFLKDRFPLGAFWTGYNRISGSYVWDAGSVGTCSSTYINWRAGEPSGGTEQCVEEGTADGAFNDANCGQSIDGCICETNQVVARESCPTGWTVSNDGASCYYFHNLYTTWGVCNNFCAAQGEGAQMLCVQNAAQNAFIWQKRTNKYTWVGFQKSNGAFKWNSGCTSSYTNWNVGEPNGGADYVAFIDSGYNGKWDDVPTTSTAACACQINHGFNPTSQPSRQPVSDPTSQPSRQPSRQPSGQPSSMPTSSSIPVSDMLDSSSYKVTNAFAFAVVASDRSVYAWGEAAPGGNLTWPTKGLLSSSVSAIVPSRHAFTALKLEGSVVPWGVPSHYAGVLPAGPITRLVATEAAFAVITTDGAVKAFGAYQNGGNVADDSKCNGFSAQLSASVQAIVATSASFTALKTDGTVYTWGCKYCGGGVSSETMTALQQVVQVVATTEAFAARLASGRVMTWGGVFAGGDSSAVTSQLSANVLHIVGAKAVFAAFKQDASLVVWGHGPYGGVPSPEDAAARLAHGVIFVAHTFMALAALHADGTVTAWGDADNGGDASVVRTQLVDIATIVGNGYAFAALSETGGVVAWGNPTFGGQIPTNTTAQLYDGVVSIHHTNRAFAALKRDGSLVVWGQAGHGGNPGAAVQALLTSGVHTICSNDAAFLAFKTDGSVVGWGHPVSVPVPGMLFNAANLMQHVTCA